MSLCVTYHFTAQPILHCMTCFTVAFISFLFSLLFFAALYVQLIVSSLFLFMLFFLLLLLSPHMSSHEWILILVSSLPLFRHVPPLNPQLIPMSLWLTLTDVQAEEEVWTGNSEVQSAQAGRGIPEIRIESAECSPFATQRGVEWLDRSSCGWLLQSNQSDLWNHHWVLHGGCLPANVWWTKVSWQMKKLAKKVGIEFSFSSFLVANNSLHFLKHASLCLWHPLILLSL